MRRTFAMLALAASVTTSVQAQRAWQSEIGIQGGYTRIVLAGSGGDPTDVFSLPGFNVGPAAPLPAAVYVILPWKEKIAIEPEVAFSQVVDPNSGISATLVHLGLRADYALSRDFYASAGGLLGYISSGGTSETQVGVQAAAGYRRHLTGPLNARLEARLAVWGKTEAVSPYDVYSVLIGISTATRRSRAAPARPASARGQQWTKQLGVAGGYVSLHPVGGIDATMLVWPGWGGGFQALGGTGGPLPISSPPTVFAIFPVGRKVALEPGIDIHRGQSGGTTNFSGNLGLRLDYAVTGGWYGAVGGNLNYLKSTGIDAATRTGLQLAWGYRFGLTGSLGGRVETNYTLWGQNADLGILPINTFAIMAGVTMPL